MSRTLLVIAGVIAFLSGAHVASAFTTYPVDPVTTNDRLGGPDQLSNKITSGQSGGATLGLPGGLPGPSGYALGKHKSANNRLALRSVYCRRNSYINVLENYRVIESERPRNMETPTLNQRVEGSRPPAPTN